MSVSPARAEAMDAILDGAESLLVEVGYSAITTRKLAERAGVNQGLVHYYFGSMEEVYFQVLERYTDRLTARQRALYATDEPFLQKWRTAMAYLVADDESEYQKIWFELQAMAWSRPEMRDRIGRVLADWQAVLTSAVRDGLRELGVDTRRYPVEAVVSLVVTFNEGVMLERLSGVDSGHTEVLQMIDRMLVRLQRDQSKGAKG
jgi:AcrR family transcriptional regulator